MRTSKKAKGQKETPTKRSKIRSSIFVIISLYITFGICGICYVFRSEAYSLWRSTLSVFVLQNENIGTDEKDDELDDEENEARPKVDILARVDARVNIPQTLQSEYNPPRNTVVKKKKKLFGDSESSNAAVASGMELSSADDGAIRRQEVLLAQTQGFYQCPQTGSALRHDENKTPLGGKVIHIPMPWEKGLWPSREQQQQSRERMTMKQMKGKDAFNHRSGAVGLGGGVGGREGAGGGLALGSGLLNLFTGHEPPSNSPLHDAGMMHNTMPKTSLTQAYTIPPTPLAGVPTLKQV